MNQNNNLILPPLLVQRCNGTTARLGYLEVLELSMQILLLGQLASVRTVNTNWGRGYNSSTDSNPNTISSIQLQYIQAASPHLADKTTSNPNRNVVCLNLLHINLHTVPLYGINIQREWHWPPNIYKNKKPVGVCVD
jgi:hypothetical protein